MPLHARRKRIGPRSRGGLSVGRRRGIRPVPWDHAGVATQSEGTEKPTRRTAIADAAIELLAELGSRGLTHRQVDRRLEIPEGSTGAYYRTRQALLEATAKRVGELDNMEIELMRSVDLDGIDVVKTITALVMSTS